MSHAKRRYLPVVMAAAVGFGVSAAARADDASNQQMQQKIDQLEAKVQALETQSSAPQADATASIQRVMSDADQHSRLMDSMGAGTGYDKATGFHIGSDDGNFYLHPFGLFQFQGVLNWRGATKPADHGIAAPVNGTSFSDGFDVRRIKIGADGHIYSPNLGYYFQLDTMRTGGGVSLDDAYLTYKAGDNFTVKAGQFKDIAWHESSVDDAFQLAADESLVNGLIGGTMGSNSGLGANQARVQGISVAYSNGTIRGELAGHDGYASQNTPFFDTATPLGIAGIAVAVPPTNWGMSGRVEYKILGGADAWDQYSRMSAYGDGSEDLIAGAGFDYTEAGKDHTFFWTGDVQYANKAGLSLYGAFLGQYLRTPSGAVGGPGSRVTTANSYGWLIQGGWVIPNTQWEPFARYDFTHLDDGVFNAAGITNHNLHELTAGVNYYMYGNNAKFTVDATYLPGGSPFDADGLGFLQQSPNHPEWVLRAQFQLKI